MKVNNQQLVSVNTELLHNRVWSKPLKELAAELMSTEHILIARCIELQVPRPMQGYWRAVAKGTAPPVPSLPAYKEKESISPLKEPDVPSTNEVEGEQPLTSGSKPASKGRPKSPSRSTLGAQLFSTAKEILLKSQITELGYYKPLKRKLLDVNVTDSGLSDAEAFLLKLFTAAEKGGLRIRLVEMNESLRRRDISVSEDGSRDFIYPSIWKPSNESVMCVDGLNVGFSLVEMTENVPTKQVKGRYVRDEKMINWSHSKIVRTQPTWVTTAAGRYPAGDSGFSFTHPMTQMAGIRYSHKPKTAV